MYSYLVFTLFYLENRNNQIRSKYVSLVYNRETCVQRGSDTEVP